MKKPAGKIKTFFIDIFYGGREYKTTTAEKTPLPLKTIATFAVATVLLLALVFSFIQTSELSAEIARFKRQITNLKDEAENLKDDLEHKYSYADIVEYAESLGYVKGGGQVVYIDPEETAETDDKDADSKKGE